MVSSRPLDMIRINQSPTLLVFRNSFDQITVPRRVLKVFTIPLVYRFSFSTSLSALPIPSASSAPDLPRIPVSTRPPNTPHHRRVESELLDGEIEKIPSNPSTTAESPSTEATPLDDKNHDTVIPENNTPTSIPPLIHQSGN